MYLSKGVVFVRWEYERDMEVSIHVHMGKEGRSWIYEWENEEEYDNEEDEFKEIWKEVNRVIPGIQNSPYVILGNDEGGNEVMWMD